MFFYRNKPPSPEYLPKNTALFCNFALDNSQIIRYFRHIAVYGAHRMGEIHNPSNNYDILPKSSLLQ